MGRNFLFWLLRCTVTSPEENISRSPNFIGSLVQDQIDEVDRTEDKSYKDHAWDIRFRSLGRFFSSSLMAQSSPVIFVLIFRRESSSLNSQRPEKKKIPLNLIY